MLNYEIRNNKQYGSVEVFFHEIPDAATREALKANAFRWHAAKKCWYGYKTAEEVAEILKGGKAAEPKQSNNIIDVSLMDDWKLNAYGADLAKVIREQLKKCGARGVTVSAGRGGYTTSIKIKVSMTPEDFRSIEELEKREPLALERALMRDCWVYLNGEYMTLEKYQAMAEEEKAQANKDYYIEQIRRAANADLNLYHLNGENYPEYTSAALERLQAIYKIANYANYDNSDSMSDYFDIGYYLDLIIKCEDFEPRENMTEEEREALEEERKQKEAEQARRMAEYERQEEENRKAAEAYEKQRKIDRAEILKNIKVEELTTEKSFFISGLYMGIGKEYFKEHEELKAERAATNNNHLALINQIVSFTNAEALELFKSYILDNWDFMSGHGGTGTNDSRIDTWDTYRRLNEEQRETVKTYCYNCIAVYYNDVLQFVIDPEGYNYGRYILTLTDKTAEHKPEDSETIAPNEAGGVPFYFPEPVQKQADSLKVGDYITIFKDSVACLNILQEARGQLESIEKYDNSISLYITEKKKLYRINLSNSDKFMVFNGSAFIPDNVRYAIDRTENGCRATMEKYNAELLKELPAVFGKPLIDTVQR